MPPSPASTASGKPCRRASGKWTTGLMSDDIDEEMRAMIDAAVTAGLVQHIPRGQSGDVVHKASVGRKKDVLTIRRVKLLADLRMSDGEIADRIGKTRKAVSNCRYRHGIENGWRKRVK